MGLGKNNSGCGLVASGVMGSGEIAEGWAEVASVMHERKSITKWGRQ